MPTKIGYFRPLVPHPSQTAISFSAIYRSSASSIAV